MKDHNDIIIRHEKEDDFGKTEALVREAFWNVYRPGAIEHYVLHTMRSSPQFVQELSFVMEKNGKIIGQSVFVRTEINADDGRSIPICAMGPICIAKSEQRKGYGKILLDYSIEKAKEFGIKALCLEGNIDFYGKSGFDYARSFGIRYHAIPAGADDSFFLCRELSEGYLCGITGEYTPPSVYFVNESDAEAFDMRFPKKEKLSLPTHLV